MKSFVTAVTLLTIFAMCFLGTSTSAYAEWVKNGIGWDEENAQYTGNEGDHEEFALQVNSISQIASGASSSDGDGVSITGIPYFRWNGGSPSTNFTTIVTGYIWGSTAAGEGSQATASSTVSDLVHSDSCIAPSDRQSYSPNNVSESVPVSASGLTTYSITVLLQAFTFATPIPDPPAGSNALGTSVASVTFSDPT